MITGMAAGSMKPVGPTSIAVAGEVSNSLWVTRSCHSPSTGSVRRAIHSPSPTLVAMTLTLSSRAVKGGVQLDLAVVNRRHAVLKQDEAELLLLAGGRRIARGGDHGDLGEVAGRHRHRAEGRDGGQCGERRRGACQGSHG